MQDFHLFKKEIGLAVCHVKLKCEEIKLKIRQHLFSEQLPEGLLTHNEKVYYDCVDIKQEELDRILFKDETYWKTSLKDA